VQLEAAGLMVALDSPSAQVRGRAAVRLGWRRERKAVGALLHAAHRAKGDICPIVDALGRIGDPAAIELARGLATRSQLSRRRSGVEALRNLGDAEGLAMARQANQARLPAKLAEVLASADESRVTASVVSAMEAAIAGEDPRKRGTIADALYERDTPLALRVARRMITSDSIRAPHQWRYAKSVLKRAMLRDDTATFAQLAYAIERASLGYAGATAVVTSGLDGQKRSTLVFGKRTQAYVRRATWRYLRDLARYEPALYVDAAARVLGHYRPTDAKPPTGPYGAFADAFLLNRILYGASDRMRVDWRAMRHKFLGVHAVRPKVHVREEAFSRLWDAYPAAHLAVLARAQLPEIEDFALRGVIRHPHVLADAAVAVLLDIAARDREAVRELVRGELERRLAADPSDWALVEAVIARGLPALRDASVRWLDATAAAWTTDEARLSACFAAADPRVRTEAARIAAPRVAAASAELRERLADRLLAVIATDEPQPGAHAAWIHLAREALVPELERRFDLDALIDAVRTGNTALQQVAGFLLGRRDGALAKLGLAGLVALANHELVAVRMAGHAIVRGAAAQLVRDPSALFALAESEWDDTRELAAELLRGLPLAALGLDGVIGLCDSTTPSVQELGRELVVRHFAELDADTVLFRLTEHPARAMRIYALALVREHLRPGMVPLARIEGFMRTTLFDPRPNRGLKVGLLELLLDRGLMDENQAELVAGVLGDLLRTHTVFDFQRVSQALARIQTAFPEVTTELQLAGQGA
ncbi:MAG TPA: hypothetical protein VFG69_11350, partial [Nannocystaceae bacterium]|nr:hypothetical protein [Nannocystaceae bacterium]